MIQTLDPETIDSYDDRIRAAYRHLLHDLGAQPGDYVSLTDLRPYIGGHRPHVDEALRRMGRGNYAGPGQVHLTPDSNQKTLSQLDRAEAVILGDQANHLLSIRP